MCELSCNVIVVLLLCSLVGSGSCMSRLCIVGLVLVVFIVVSSVVCVIFVGSVMWWVVSFNLFVFFSLLWI